MEWTKLAEMSLKLSAVEKAYLVAFLSGELQSDVENLSSRLSNAKTAMRLARKINNGENKDIDSLLEDEE